MKIAGKLVIDLEFFLCTKCLETHQRVDLTLFSLCFCSSIIRKIDFAVESTVIVKNRSLKTKDSSFQAPAISRFEF